jgi:hypothetical protein
MTLVAGGIAQSWRGDLCITADLGSRPLSGDVPEHNRCRLGPLAYNAYVARGKALSRASHARVRNTHGAHLALRRISAPYDHHWWVVSVVSGDSSPPISGFQSWSAEGTLGTDSSGHALEGFGRRRCR